MTARPDQAPKRVRVFFALWPDAVVADQLADCARRVTPATARRMKRDTLHLTLAFVGDVDVDRVPELLEIGDRIVWPATTLHVDRVEHWKHHGIVWAGYSQTPAPLKQLADDLENALNTAGFELPSRPFVPHVTLARKVAAMRPGQVPSLDLEWKLTSAVLVASRRNHEGAAYEVLRRWPAK